MSKTNLQIKTNKTENKIPKKFNFFYPNKIISDKEKMYRTLDQDGRLINLKYHRVLTDDQIRRCYEHMVLSRQQETYMVQLQRQGRMLSFPTNTGEEALQVAVAQAMEKNDWFVPAFRSNATMLMLGVPLINLIRYWNGQEDGSKMPSDVNVLPMNIPIATQYSHCAGIALALKIQKKPNVAVAFIGDGGTSEGEFYEALNFASVQKLPAVFCINNNKWAISTPLNLNTITTTLSQKAVAFGMPSARVDGNDLLASYDVIKQAIEYAREGNGPILVEFVTWRQGAHTTADNPRLYRSEADEKEAEKFEPFHRIEKYMIDNNIIKQAEIDKLKEEKITLVKDIFQKSLIGIDTKLDDIFDYTYENMPPELAEQKVEAKKYWIKERITWTDKEVN